MSTQKREEMKLKTYLKKSGISVRKFGKLVDISYTSVQRYVSGERTPRLKVALKIERVTKGLVSVKDLCQ